MTTKLTPATAVRDRNCLRSIFQSFPFKLSRRTVTHVLRSKIKARGLTLSELAKQLKLPLSTLKKWLSAKDGNFSRITQVADAVGISLPEILKIIDQEQVYTIEYTKAQQALFEKDYETFAVYWLLVYERMSTENVKRIRKLSDSKFLKILYRLDALSLLHLEPNNRVRVPKLAPVKWKFKGPFLERLMRDLAMSLLSESLMALAATDGLSSAQHESTLYLQMFQLSASSTLELHRDLEQLEQKYAARTILELHILGEGSKQLIKTRLLMARRQGSFLK